MKLLRDGVPMPELVWACKGFSSAGDECGWAPISALEPSAAAHRLAREQLVNHTPTAGIAWHVVVSAAMGHTPAARYEFELSARGIKKFRRVK